MLVRVVDDIFLFLVLTSSSGWTSCDLLKQSLVGVLHISPHFLHTCANSIYRVKLQCGWCHKLISRDRPAKCCVFIKERTKIHFTFCLAAWSFLLKGIEGVVEDYSLVNTIRNMANLFTLQYGDSIIESSLTKIYKLNFCPCRNPKKICERSTL